MPESAADDAAPPIGTRCAVERWVAGNGKWGSYIGAPIGDTLVSGTRCGKILITGCACGPLLWY